MLLHRSSRLWPLVTLLLAVVPPSAGDSAAPPKPASQLAKVRDWTFLYVMSYDNNLDGCTKPITEGLGAGIANDHVAVNILSDTPDRKGLRRLALSAAGSMFTRLKSEDITDPNVLRDFLLWSQTNTPARHYAVVFLDHGGALDQMCMDEHTTRTGPPNPRWMSAVATGTVLRDWTTQLKNARFELLFLQQCGRGSLENLYNFRDTAGLILASQYTVGACNTYYTDMVRAACQTPDIKAEQLARTIMEDQHYTSYALLRGDKLADLPRRADALADALLKLDSQLLRVTGGLQPCFFVQGESNYDVVRVLDAIASNAGKSAPTEIESFKKWLRKDVIVQVRYRAQIPARLRLCGVSLNVPRDQAARKRYSHLPLHRDSKWAALTAAMAE